MKRKKKNITRKVTGVDKEVIRKVEAVIYIMADKFLDSAEMEQLKEEIKMTRLGKMLYDDGKTEGQRLKVKELVEKKVKKGYSVSEIAEMLEEDEAVIGAIINEL